MHSFPPPPPPSPFLSFLFSPFDLFMHLSLSPPSFSPFPPVHGGFVHLRNWASLDQPLTGKISRAHPPPPPPHPPHPPPRIRGQEADKKLLLKTKLCWFHEHHPQRCPKDSIKCPYAHGVEELKQRPDFKRAS